MEDNPIQKALALYDFKAVKNGQLSFKEGDTIMILSSVNTYIYAFTLPFCLFGYHFFCRQGIGGSEGSKTKKKEGSHTITCKSLTRTITKS